MKRDANDILREGGKEELVKAFDNAPAEPFGRPGGTKGNGDAGPPRTRPKFVVQRANSLTFSPDLEWLIKGVLPLQGVALAFGESQAFKSFVVLDMLDRVGRGEAWAGRKTRKVPVLYIAAEAPQSFAKRKTGIDAANGAPLSDDFIVITVAPNLGTEKNDLDVPVAAIEQSGVKPGLIAIDTVAASLGGGEENGTGGQIFLSNARALSNHFKACVIPVHHPGLTSGADKRPRGYSGFTCNVDVQILSSANPAASSPRSRSKR
jgi:RecA-family ATPase